MAVIGRIGMRFSFLILFFWAWGFHDEEGSSCGNFPSLVEWIIVFICIYLTKLLTLFIISLVLDFDFINSIFITFLLNFENYNVDKYALNGLWLRRVASGHKFYKFNSIL